MGVDARGVPGGLLRLDPAFAYVEPPSSWPLSRAEYLTLAPNTFPCLAGFPDVIVSMVKLTIFRVEDTLGVQVGSATPTPRVGPQDVFAGVTPTPGHLSWTIPWLGNTSQKESSFIVC